MIPATRAANHDEKIPASAYVQVSKDTGVDTASGVVVPFESLEDLACAYFGGAGHASRDEACGKDVNAGFGVYTGRLGASGDGGYDDA